MESRAEDSPAHVGHGARDEHVVKALSPETFRQIRRALDEGAEAVFEHDFVLGQNLQFGVDLVPRCADLEGLDPFLKHLLPAHGEPVGPFLEAGIIGRVLDPEHLAAGLPQRGGKAVDVGNRADRGLDWHRRVLRHHEAVLEVDDYKRGPARIYVVKDM